MGMRIGAMRLAAGVAATLIGVAGCAPGSDRPPNDTDAIQPASASQRVTPPGDGPQAGKAGSAGTPVAEPTAAPTGTPTAAPTGGGTSKAKPHGCPQGSRQRKVEEYLSRLGGYGTITVDGVQSAADCKAIKKFQRRFGISPATGRAGDTTMSVARRLASTDTSKCAAGKGLTFCVDLTHQTVWAMRDGVVVHGPTVTRTGMAGGYQTPAGKYRVGWRNRSEWSNPYKVWLPYWQQFNGGMGFHETTTYIHNSFGSHGCVNLLHADAKKFWELGSVGTRVHVFGRRPGT